MGTTVSPNSLQQEGVILPPEGEYTPFAVPDMIYAAMQAVMNDVQAVGKDGRNSQQGYSFRGVDAVVNAVGPALRSHGVLALPRVLSMKHRDFTTEKGKTQHEAVVEVLYTFYALDGSYLETSVVGEASDFSDKATTQAMSVAWRTMWIQALAIPTDSPDPDESGVVRGEVRGMVLHPSWETLKERDDQWKINVDLLKSVPEGPALDEVMAWGKAEGLDQETMTKGQAEEWYKRLGKALDDQPPSGPPPQMTYAPDEEPF